MEFVRNGYERLILEWFTRVGTFNNKNRKKGREMNETNNKM